MLKCFTILCFSLLVSLHSQAEKNKSVSPISQAVSKIDSHLTNKEKTLINLLEETEFDHLLNEEISIAAAQQANTKLEQWLRIHIRQNEQLKAYFAQHGITDNQLTANYLIKAWSHYSLGKKFDEASQFKHYSEIEERHRKFKAAVMTLAPVTPKKEKTQTTSEKKNTE